MNDIFWINGEALPRLAIVLCPRGDSRLEDELLRMKDGGLDTVVSMLEPTEAERLGLGDEARIAEQVGLQFVSYPIPDTQVPGDVKGFREFAENLAERLAVGEAVGVHCRGCIGRSTVATACALIHMGWTAGEALAAIRIARGVPVPDTREQERWILAYTYKAEP